MRQQSAAPEPVQGAAAVGVGSLEPDEELRHGLPCRLVCKLAADERQSCIGGLGQLHLRQHCSCCVQEQLPLVLEASVIRVWSEAPVPRKCSELSLAVLR